MPRRIRAVYLLILLLLMVFQQVQPAQAEAALATMVAARGLPGSAEFGFGAILNPNGAKAAEAAALSAKLELDWISVPVVWAAVQPDPASAPNLASLDTLLQPTGTNLPAVMVSLSGAPGWASTSQGPNPTHTAQFVLALVRRYPAIRAIELFPGANTQQGWGSAPNPAAYANLYRTVSDTLRAAGSGAALVAGGLQPQPANPPAGNVDDLTFLAGLYQQGAAKWMTVISIQYTDVAVDPLRYPDGSERRVLRHYEEVRQVMIANKHTSARIWITRFCLPSGTIGVQDKVSIDVGSQSAWIIQGVTQMRSQLYIGAVFLVSLNSRGEGIASEPLVLMQGEGTQHPFSAQLAEMISLNQAGSGSIVPGKAKEGGFEKKRP